MGKIICNTIDINIYELKNSKLECSFKNAKYRKGNYSPFHYNEPRDNISDKIFKYNYAKDVRTYNAKYYDIVGRKSQKGGKYILMIRRWGSLYGSKSNIYIEEFASFEELLKKFREITSMIDVTIYEYDKEDFSYNMKIMEALPYSVVE